MARNLAEMTSESSLSPVPDDLPVAPNTASGERVTSAVGIARKRKTITGEVDAEEKPKKRARNVKVEQETYTYVSPIV